MIRCLMNFCGVADSRMAGTATLPVRIKHLASQFRHLLAIVGWHIVAALALLAPVLPVVPV